MKLVKKITINEAVAKMGNEVQPVASVVFADAINQTKKNKETILDLVAANAAEMPNQDRFAHSKVDATKEMKKMKLAESLFTEWFEEDDANKKSFAQPNLILEEDQYELDEMTGAITVSKAVFDDYMEGKRLNIKFAEDNAEDDIWQYKMVSETEDAIIMEYIGEAIPGIDEEVADCQKYPVQKPEAKDSTFVSARDKQPEDVVKAKDSGFVSAEDKQPNKAAMKESVEGDFTIEINNDIYCDEDGNAYHFNSPEEAQAFIEEHELENAEVTRQHGKELVKEAFNNWNSPESRIERYETDLPELMATMHDHYMNGRVEAKLYAEALKVAYDALDSVPHMDEALEDSQRYPIEKPKAKDSQFVSKEDKQPKAAVDAKDSGFVSAGDKDPNKAFEEKRLGESLDQPLNEEVVYTYANKRDPLGEIIQVELTEGEWGYREENGKKTATRLPSANYPEDTVGVRWDEEDKFAITVLAKSTEELAPAIRIAVKYNKDYKIERLVRVQGGYTVRLWIYVDEEKDFDQPYVGPSNVVDMSPIVSADQAIVESLTAEQKFPVESPIAEDLDIEECAITEEKDLEEAVISVIGAGNFKPNPGKAKETFDIIMNSNKIGVFDFTLEELFPQGATEAEVNKLLEEQSDWILNLLAIDVPHKDEVELED